MTFVENPLQRTSSYHPNEHKRAAIAYVIGRMNLYPLSNVSKNREAHIVQTILYITSIIPLTCCRIFCSKVKKRPSQLTHKKRATFTYRGKQVRKKNYLKIPEYKFPIRLTTVYIITYNIKNRN
jgi:hypothetical protein